MLFMTKAVIKHFKKDGVIIKTASVTAYKGSAHLLDYSSTKGAIVAFTRSLSQALAEKGIRVNGVAPGPIWTLLIPSTFHAKDVETFGSDVTLGRPGQPEEIAPSFVFLASDDSSHMTGQILHPNGGTVVNVMRWFSPRGYLKRSEGFSIRSRVCRLRCAPLGVVRRTAFGPP